MSIKTKVLLGVFFISVVILVITSSVMLLSDDSSTSLPDATPPPDTPDTSRSEIDTGNGISANRVLPSVLLDTHKTTLSDTSHITTVEKEITQGNSTTTITYQYKQSLSAQSTTYAVNSQTLRESYTDSTEPQTWIHEDTSTISSQPTTEPKRFTNELQAIIQTNGFNTYTGDYKGTKITATNPENQHVYTFYQLESIDSYDTSFTVQDPGVITQGSWSISGTTTRGTPIAYNVTYTTESIGETTVNKPNWVPQQ